MEGGGRGIEYGVSVIVERVGISVGLVSNDRLCRYIHV